VFKARIDLGPSYLSDLVHAYVLYRTLRSSDTPTLTVRNFKLKTVGDWSFCSGGPILWNSLPHSLRAGTLACSDDTPGNVTALRRLLLLATHFGGLLSDQTLLFPPSVERVGVRKRADNPQDCERAVKSLHVDLYWAHCRVQSTYGEKCMYVCDYA